MIADDQLPPTALSKELSALITPPQESITEAMARPVPIVTIADHQTTSFPGKIFAVFLPCPTRMPFPY